MVQQCRPSLRSRRFTGGVLENILGSLGLARRGVVICCITRGATIGYFGVDLARATRGSCW